jgi:hypothetical protein
MKSLNENIGLSGTVGMSHFDGKFDVDTEPSVVVAKDNLLKLQSEFVDAKEKLAFYTDEKLANIQADNKRCYDVNKGSPGDIDTCVATWITPAYRDRTEKINRYTKLVNELPAKIGEAVKKFEESKFAAIEANNKIVEAQIKVLAEKAKTDPDALKQLTVLNEQKLAGEQALAKQKSSSSNIKIYVIVGATLLALVAIAGIWIWLKSRKAV